MQVLPVRKAVSPAKRLPYVYYLRLCFLSSVYTIISYLFNNSEKNAILVISLINHGRKNHAKYFGNDHKNDRLL